MGEWVNGHWSLVKIKQRTTNHEQLTTDNEKNLLWN